MTTPNVDPNSLLRRLIALEQRCADLESDNEELTERVNSLQANAANRSSNSEEHTKQKTMIMQLFGTVPKGFKMTIPTVVENLNDAMTAGQVASRVGTLVREGKLLKHQEDGKHPKFSRA